MPPPTDDAELPAMPLLLEGFTAHTVHTGEIDIGYSTGPDNGPPLLLLHGVTSRRDGFLRVVDPLVEHHRVISMDQRGHGLSGHAPGRYTRADHARDIRFVLEHVCETPSIVWGHSMGGGNAVQLLAGADAPPLRALVLEDPAVFGATRPGPPSGGPVQAMFRLFLSLIDDGLTVEQMIPVIARALPSQPDYLNRWKAECLVQMDAEILRNIVAGVARSADEPAELLRRIECPVLLVQADPEAGGILPDDYLETIVPRRDGFTVRKLAGAGHNINRDFPDGLLAAVLPWLEGLR